LQKELAAKVPAIATPTVRKPTALATKGIDSQKLKEF